MGMLKRDDLHDYQRYAVEFVETHAVALLILTMGLGKTIISLTAIVDLLFDSFESRKVLIIAPLRVARDVWPQEKDQWEHTKDLRMSVMTGSCKERVRALKTRANIYVINRENVKWLVEYLEQHHQPWPFDTVVIDEITSFKNARSERYKALRKVRPYIKRIWGLTGTPTPQGLLDLWAEVSILDMGKRLGRFIGRYREAYFRPGAMNPYTGVIYNYVPLPGAEEAIYKKISDMTISMKSMDFLDMPDKVDVKHEVVMDGKERKLYDKFRKEMALDLKEGTVDAANAAVLSGKLQQLANGAIYIDKDRNYSVIHNRKLDMLEDLVEQANGQSVLVAVWYQHDKERIMERLTDLGYHPREIRSSQDIEDWNTPGKIDVGLISPASAGHGLNLQKGGAHILIYFSEVWSLELVQQMDARLWRQGQKNTVTIHHIICKDTVDEDILAALESKNTTQANLIAAVKARLE